MTPFRWDYPTQGLRYPRTMAQAFGPYAELSLPPRVSRAKTIAMYTVAALLLIAAALMWVLG